MYELVPCLIKWIDVEAVQVVANTEGPTSDSIAKSSMSLHISTGRQSVGAPMGLKGRKDSCTEELGEKKYQRPLSTTLTIKDRSSFNMYMNRTASINYNSL